MNVRDSIFGLISIAFLGNVVGRGLAYLLNFVIAAGLGPEAIGHFAFGVVIMNVGSIFSRLGLDGAVRKLIPVYLNENDDGKLTGAILLGLLVPVLSGTFVVLAVLSALKAEIGLFSRSTVGVLFFVGAIPLLGLFRVSTRASEGFKRTEYAVVARDIIRPGIALLFAFVGSYIVNDIYVVIAGYVAALVVAIFASVLFLHHQNAFTAIRDIQFDQSNLLNLSLPMFFSNLGQYFVFWIDVLVLGLFVSATAVGKYQIAYQTTVVLTFILLSVNSLFPSIAADLYDGAQYDQLETIFESTTKWVTYLTGFGYAFLVIYAEPVLALFGSEFTTVTTILIILATAQLIGAVVGPVGFMLTMSEHERVELVNAMSAAVLNLGLNLLLVPRYGIIGAAFATATSITVLNVLRVVEVWQLLGMTPYSKQYIFGTMCLFLATTVMLLVRQTDLSGQVLLVAAGLSSGIVFLLALWLVAVDERDYLLLEAA